ncbi:MAG: hypothetical protein JRH20_09655 [Deltaproteobacteria bacterium]|nr:hypothetical protein [Deltaproteobacteria bacterium]
MGDLASVSTRSSLYERKCEACGVTVVDDGRCASCGLPSMVHAPTVIEVPTGAHGAVVSDHTERDVPALREDEDTGLRTMPLERLPSDIATVRVTPQPNPQLADTRRQVTAIGDDLEETLPPAKTQQQKGVSLEDTLPPTPPQERAAFANACTKLECPPDLTPAPIIMKNTGPAAPSPLALRESLGANLLPDDFPQSALSTMPLAQSPVRQGVNPWLLTLWVTALTSVVAAILVVFLR